MLANLFLMLAASATAAPVTLPTAIPIPVSSNAPFVFHTPTFAEQHPFVLNLIQMAFLVSTIALVGLMSVQTTKTEGLSGSIGGRAESAYHGRLGFEQQMTRATTVTAVAWIILAVAYFWATR